MIEMVAIWTEAAECALVDADRHENAANLRFARQSSRFAGGYYVAAGDASDSLEARLELLKKAETCYRRGQSPDAKRVSARVAALKSELRARAVLQSEWAAQRHADGEEGKRST